MEVMLAIINLKVTHPRQVTEKRWKPDIIYNKPFPKCLKPFFRNKRKCTIFDMKMFCYSRAKNIIFTTTKKKRSGIQPRFESEVSWNSGLVFRFGTRVSGKSLRLLFSKKKFISSTNDVTKVEGFNIISWIINAFYWLLPMIYWRTKHRWRHHYQYFALLIVYKTFHFALDLYCNRSEDVDTWCSVSAAFLFLPHFDIKCDLLLNRLTDTIGEGDFSQVQHFYYCDTTYSFFFHR